MSDRVVVGCRVNEDVLENFRKFTEEKNGHIRGEMGRNLERAMVEYMDNDRSARIERKVDELHEMMSEASSENSLDGETKSATSSNGPSDDGGDEPSINQRTRDSLNAIRAEIPNETTISESLLESAIENHAGHSYKTLQRYKEMLKNRGEILEHPLEPQKYATSPKTFVILCENNDQITLPKLRDIIIDRMDDLGEEWYLDAARDLMKHNELKVDQVMDTDAYREDHGLVLERDRKDRGVQ